MKRQFYFATLISFFIIFGCKSLSEIKTTKIAEENLTELNYMELNGNYINYPEKFVGGIEKTPYNYHPDNSAIDLYGYSFDPKNEKQINENKNEYINLEFISKKRLKLKLYRNNEFIKEKIIKGKLKKGYFYSKSKIEFYPFFPIAFGYGIEKFRIGKNNELLILDYYVNQVFAGMTGETSKGEFSGIFKKMN
jgi:hypothetical protein